jgi:tetratricopeptide (TPR) repeat protein
MNNAKSFIYTFAAISLLFIAITWGNTLWRQHSQFEEGENALVKGNFMAAIAGYESAIHMYTPGSTTVSKAANRLYAIGSFYEQSGDTEKALVAFRALRSSFHSAHWFVTPGTYWIDRCDKKISELVSKQEFKRSGQ